MGTLTAALPINSVSLHPQYHGRNYWVNDWRRYRLAAPLGYMRWVRNGSDVVLFDVRSGRAVTIYNSFVY